MVRVVRKSVERVAGTVRGDVRISDSHRAALPALALGGSITHPRVYPSFVTSVGAPCLARTTAQGAGATALLIDSARRVMPTDQANSGGEIS